MKYTNKIIPAGIIGGAHYVLSGNLTDTPGVSVYLLSNMEKKQDYSLWNVEIIDVQGNLDLWPYIGADYDDLVKQLLEDFLENVEL
jgi:hypothetical protein